MRAYAEISAERQAVVAAFGNQGWVDLLTRRRAQRLLRQRARRELGDYCPPSPAAPVDVQTQLALEGETEDR